MKEKETREMNKRHTLQALLLSSTRESLIGPRDPLARRSFCQDLPTRESKRSINQNPRAISY